MMKSVKISADVVKDVQDYKDKTGISIRIFIERAIKEKFTRLKSKKRNER